MTTTLNTVNTQTQNVEGKGAIEMKTIQLIKVAKQTSKKDAYYPVTETSVLEAHINNAGAKSLKKVKNIRSRAINNKHFTLVSEAIRQGSKVEGVSAVEVSIPESAIIEINTLEDYQAFVELVKSTGCRTYSPLARRRLAEMGKRMVIVSDEGQKILKNISQKDFYVSADTVGGSVEFLGTDGFKVLNEVNLDSTIMAIAGTVKRTLEKHKHAERKAKQTKIVQISAEDCYYDPVRKVFVATKSVTATVSSTVLLERLNERGKKLVSLNLREGSALSEFVPCNEYDIDTTNLVNLNRIHEINKNTFEPVVIPEGAQLSTKIRRTERTRRHKNRLRAMLMLGIEIDGEVYYPVVQTAAQGRTAKLWMSNLENKEAVESFRQSLAFGAFGDFFSRKDQVVMAKLESRLGLNGSTSKSVGFDVTFKRVPDACRPVSHKIKYLERVKNPNAFLLPGGRYSKYYNVVDGIETSMNIVDGAGLMSVKCAATWDLKLGNLTQAEYDYFIKNFTTLKELRTTKDSKLMGIFKKIRNAKMVRRGSNVKGLLYMHDLAAEGVEEDVILSNSMCKEEPGDVVTGGEWRICNVNDYRWEKIRLSAQMMGTLNLPRKHIKSILDENLAAFTTGILSDYQTAMKLAGVLSDFNGKTSVATKVAKALAANPLALKDPWIRKKLLEMTKKAILGLKYGEVYIPGANYFIVPDPKIFFHELTNGKGSEFNHYTDEDLLQPGTVYCNGFEEWLGAHRSPNGERSEAMLAKAVKNDDYWYLENLLVLNSFDPIAEAAGGGDKDGDIMAVTNDPRIIETIRRNKSRIDYYIRQGLPDKAIKRYYSFESVIELYVTNSELSMVGTISNKAAHNMDYRNHLVYEMNQLVAQRKTLTNSEEDQELYFKLTARINEIVNTVRTIDHNIIILCGMIGGAVDAGKTGVQPVVAVEVEPTHIPEHFFAKELDYAGCLTPDKIEGIIEAQRMNNITVYRSESPLGFCYTYVAERTAEILADLEEEAKEVSQNIAASLIARFKQEEVDEVQDDVIRLIRNYGDEVRNLKRYKNSFEVLTSDEEAYFEEQFGLIIDRYSALMDAIHENKALVAAVAYSAVHNAEVSKSGFVAWGLCFEGMITLLGEGYHNASILLPSDVTPEDEAIVVRGTLFINGKMIRSTSLPVGKYNITEVDGRCYLLARVVGEAEYVAKEKDTLFQPTGEVFSAKATGFSYNRANNAEGLLALLEENNWEFTIRESREGCMMFYVDGNDLPIASYQSMKGAVLTTVKRQVNKRCRLVNPLENSMGVNGIYRLNKSGEIVMKGAVELVFEVIGEATSLFDAHNKDEVVEAKQVEPVNTVTAYEALDFSYTSVDEEDLAILAMYERELERENMYC